jgi:hypothetical protein
MPDKSWKLASREKVLSSNKRVTEFNPTHARYIYTESAPGPLHHNEMKLILKSWEAKVHMGLKVHQLEDILHPSLR